MFSSYFFLALLLSLVVSSELPLPLTIDTFDSAIKEDLHFIEFFSPYCSHCNLLAPTWESTYNNFESDSNVLKVHMHQVNCVESGDLCDRESIKYYPLLRLYSGDGEKGSLKLSYPAKYKRTEKMFIKFMKEQSSEVIKDLPNKSSLVKTLELLQIMSGDIEEPILVSFWPTTDEQLNEQNFDSMNQDKLIKDFYFDECPECFELRNFWGRLSNQLEPVMKSGFVNCMSNRKICESLRLKDLINVSPNSFKKPVIMLFLPHVGANRVDYKGDTTDDKSIVKWCEKLLENYPVKDITLQDLKSNMVLAKSLGRIPASDLPVDNKVSFILYYDELSSLPEDFDILPHLLQPVMDLPFDIAIYKSSDKLFDRNMLTLEKSMLKFISYNDSEPDYEYDEELHNFNSLTSLPTMLCYKDSSFIIEKLTNFDPGDMRDFQKVNNFIQRNSLPFLNQLTPELYSQFFPKKFKEMIHTKDDLVIVTMIDSKNFNEYMQLKLQMSIENFEFYHLQQEKNFEDVREKRQAKLDKVNKMKLSKNDNNSDKIIAELRTTVDHSAFKFNTIFTFMDVSDDATMAFINEKGWNNDRRQLKLGDVFVVSRFDKFYWDKDLNGNFLINDPYTIRETLKEISFGTGNNKLIKLNLMKSPFGNKFRFMDRVHRHGIFGYLLSVIAIWGGFNLLRVCIKRKNRATLMEQRNKGLGILGRIPKSD